MFHILHNRQPLHCVLEYLMQPLVTDDDIFMLGDYMVQLPLGSAFHDLGVNLLWFHNNMVLGKKEARTLAPPPRTEVKKQVSTL